MPRDGNGTYIRTDGVRTGATVFQQEEAANIDILSENLDAEAQDMAEALTQSISNDGQTNPVANLPMAGFRHTGVGNGVANTDYAALGQVLKLFASMVNASGGSAADAITASISPTPSSLSNGQQVAVYINHGANTTATPTFSLNAFTAKTIVRSNNQPLVPGDTGGSGYVCLLAYSSTLDKWILLNPNRIPVGNMYATQTDILFGRSTSGAGVGEEIACTAAGRAILDDADAAAQRMTLGVAYASTAEVRARSATDKVLSPESLAKSQVVDWAVGKIAATGSGGYPQSLAVTGGTNIVSAQKINSGGVYEVTVTDGGQAGLHPVVTPWDGGGGLTWSIDTANSTATKLRINFNDRDAGEVQPFTIRIAAYF